MLSRKRARGQVVRQPNGWNGTRGRTADCEMCERLPSTGLLEAGGARVVGAAGGAALRPDVVRRKQPPFRRHSPKPAQAAILKL